MMKTTLLATLLGSAAAFAPAQNAGTCYVALDFLAIKTVS